MKSYSSLAVTSLILLAPFAVAEKADPKLQEKLVGKWQATDTDVKGSLLEFMKSGEVRIVISAPDVKTELTGKFRVLSEDTIEMTMKLPDGKEKTDKVRFAMEKDTLTITGPDGKPVKFVKAK
jgi:uncharacterized protein (TIGR03066 family)